MQQTGLAAARVGDNVAHAMARVGRRRRRAAALQLRRHVRVALLGDELTDRDNKLAERLERWLKRGQRVGGPDVGVGVAGERLARLGIVLSERRVVHRVCVVRPLGQVGPPLKALFTVRPADSVVRLGTLGGGARAGREGSEGGAEGEERAPRRQ